MNSLLKWVIFLLSITATLCATPQVYRNDLNEEAKDLAIGVTEDGVINQQNGSAIAKRLSDDFNRLYGGNWLSLVGPSGIDSVVSQMSPVANTLLWFSYNNTHVVVFRTTITFNTTVAQNRTSFADVVSRALRGGLTYRYEEYQTNTTKNNRIVQIMGTALARNFSAINCELNLPDDWELESCYFQLIQFIADGLKSAFGNHWAIIVEIVNSGSFYRDSSLDSTLTYYEYVYGNVLNFIIIESRAN